MSTAPAKDAPPKAPPEEKFWKRYSPHGEAPMSAAGSFAFHTLGVGGLILAAVYLSALFVKPANELPVTPVRLDLTEGGGGGSGKEKGTGGLGTNRIDDVGESQEKLPPQLLPEELRPSLNPVEKAKVELAFDQEATRFIQQNNSESTKAFARLNDGVRRKLNDNLNPDKGQGGGGSGGGKGEGDGMGVGGGKGEGKMALNKREKRMLRWHMRFTAQNGGDYLTQLRSLGAKLAFPLGEDSGDPKFYVVERLAPGEPAKVMDVARFNSIYWIDDKPNSVSDIMGALQLRLPGQPTRFVAFMPKSLEDRLYAMEKKYVEGVLRQNFDEDAIQETTFTVVPVGRGYQPEIRTVQLR